MNPKDTFHHDLKDTLLREGVLSMEALNEILREQEKGKDSLLDVMIRMGKFDEKKLVHVLSRQYGCTAVNPAVFVIDQALLDLIPKKIAEKYSALPITQLDRTLTVAFANPTNLKAIDELRAITGMRIKPAVAQASLLKKYVEKYYNQKAAANGGAAATAEHGQELDNLVKMIEVEQAGDKGA